MKYHAWFGASSVKTQGFLKPWTPNNNGFTVQLTISINVHISIRNLNVKKQHIMTHKSTNKKLLTWHNRVLDLSVHALVPINGHHLQHVCADGRRLKHTSLKCIHQELWCMVIVVLYVDDDPGQGALGRSALVPHHDGQLMLGDGLTIQLPNGGDHTWEKSVVL